MPNMSIKEEAHPNSLKTNENKTVLIPDSYYNNTNLNLQKKFILKRALCLSVRRKRDLISRFFPTFDTFVWWG